MADITFHEYDTGGKGSLTAADLTALLEDLKFAVEPDYVDGLLKVSPGR